jgi:hypothetical protein
MKDAPGGAQQQVDWGLPDWRDGKQYPDHNVVSILEWCWEFLRRNAEYRDFWLRKIRPYWQARATIPQRVEEFISGQLDRRQAEDLFLQIWDLPPEQRNQHFHRLSGGSPSSDSAKSGNVQVLDGGHVMGWEEARRRFGLFKPVDPRKRQTDAVFELAGATEVFDVAVDTERDDKMERDDKLWIEFDLCSPIEPQLNRAKLLFRVRQRTLKLLSSDVRPRIDLFANYLRVLDAKAAGATDAEIAGVLFLRLNADDGVKRVRNFYKRARALRDGGYRQLAARADDAKS